MMLLVAISSSISVALILLLFGIVIAGAVYLSSCGSTNVNFNFVASMSLVVTLSAFIMNFALIPFFKKVEEEAKQKTQNDLMSGITLEFEKIKKDIEKSGISTSAVQELKKEIDGSLNKIEAFEKRGDASRKASKWLKPRNRRKLAMQLTYFVNNNTDFNIREEKEFFGHMLICITWLYSCLKNNSTQKDIKPDLKGYEPNKFILYESGIKHLEKLIPETLPSESFDMIKFYTDQLLEYLNT
ncbi:hypothetical protein H6F50_12210 [Coleofasciculus sp. FACHB-712]|uniref:hypothetical protein n=1 Tax=Coleofasciculus sp. FACHB-712 TaxID=2692789 RepID=UPI0016835A99|nr:hypothetical protein [Coleofasciculus sp. FACHB-712]MBD1943117.1 hypothetical protein [Coleofasciculus sp. FACHB-712]